MIMVTCCVVVMRTRCKRIIGVIFGMHEVCDVHVVFSQLPWVLGLQISNCVLCSSRCVIAERCHLNPRIHFNPIIFYMLIDPRKQKVLIQSFLRKHARCRDSSVGEWMYHAAAAWTSGLHAKVRT